MKLSEAVQDKKFVITRLDGDTHFRERVSSMGLKEGIGFTVIKNKKKLPVLIYARDTLIAIGRAESEKIRIGDAEDGE